MHKNLPSFKKSIIIPLEVYLKECNNKTAAAEPAAAVEQPRKQQSSAEDIIKQKDLPSSLKLKLFDQHFAREESRKKRRNYAPKKQLSSKISDSKEQKIDTVVNSFQIENQPFVRSILTRYVERNKQQLDWDDNSKEIIVDGEYRRGTNIVSILKHLMRESKDRAAPSGSVEVKKILLNIGVPLEWFVITGRRSSSIIDDDVSSSSSSQPPVLVRSAISPAAAADSGLTTWQKISSHHHRTPPAPTDHERRWWPTAGREDDMVSSEEDDYVDVGDDDIKFKSTKFGRRFVSSTPRQLVEDYVEPGSRKRTTYTEISPIAKRTRGRSLLETPLPARSKDVQQHGSPLWLSYAGKTLTTSKKDSETVPPSALSRQARQRKEPLNKTWVPISSARKK